MRHARSAMFAALAALSVAGACHYQGDRTLPPERLPSPLTSRVVQLTAQDAIVRYLGPVSPDVALITRQWDAFRPDLALVDGPPPLEATPEIAVGRHSLAGVVRWLAARDAVEIRPLDPPPVDEVRAGVATAQELKMFLILRDVAADAARAPEYRAPSPETCVERSLAALASALPGPPATLAEFEQSFRRLAPSLADWRAVTGTTLDPANAAAPPALRRIARARWSFHNRFAVQAVHAAADTPRRVFALSSAASVVAQVPELRARFRRVQDLPVDPALPPRPVISLLGAALEPPPIPDPRRLELARKLIECSERCAAPHPAEDDFIWRGRTLAYLHRYHDSIDAFSEGLRRFPDSHRLLRHRGHRYITIRDFDRALADLQHAASLVEERQIPDEVEPDGAPNRAGLPRSTTNTNIVYHLGLAHYLRADFAAAATAFERCLQISPNDDMTVAAVNWLYLSRRRAGDEAGARAALCRITPTMHILENASYERLCRLYVGSLTPGDVLPTNAADPLELASTGYAVATWLALEGKSSEADRLRREVAMSPLWPAFGVIAAEADLARTR